MVCICLRCIVPVLEASADPGRRPPVYKLPRTHTRAHTHAHTRTHTHAHTIKLDVVSFPHTLPTNIGLLRRTVLLLTTGTPVLPVRGQVRVHSVPQHELVVPWYGMVDVSGCYQ